MVYRPGALRAVEFIKNSVGFEHVVHKLKHRLMPKIVVVLKPRQNPVIAPKPRQNPVVAPKPKLSLVVALRLRLRLKLKHKLKL